MNGILAIDTASPGGIALAFASAGNIRSCSLDGAQDHSTQLLTAIDRLIEGRRGDVTAVGVATGPGSYAGLRVGIATAESLGMGLDVPVFGFGTFTAIAAAVESPGALTAIHPAGRGEWAIQAISAGAPGGSPTIVSAESLPLAITLAGEAAAALGGLEVSREERARAIGRLTLQRLSDGARPQGLEAFYLREPNITRPKRAPLVSAGR